ncbi:MAG: DUF58 domain-containing protein [Bythopirellula sp.]
MAESRVNKFVASLSQRQVRDAQNGAAASPGAKPNGAGVSPAQAPPESEKREIFDPQMLSKLGQLEIIANTVVDGFLSGKHRSTHKGGCTDFVEFRPYAEGDDIRQLDWRHYAKCDRYYVKQFDDETNLQALLVADASGSMQFGMSTVTKWHYAQMACACLGHLLLRQRDSVGLAVMGDSLRHYVRPLPRASHLARVLNVLENTSAAGESTLATSLLEVTGRLKRRGMIILLSDCFGDVVQLKHVLQQFRARGHDVMVFQILAPEELTFPFRRESFFQDLELPRRMQVNPSALRKQYLAEFQSFQDELKEAMTDAGVDLVTMQTDQDLGDTLASYLHRREAQKASSRSRIRA